jgi:hypothetical protein
MSCAATDKARYVSANSDFPEQEVLRRWFFAIVFALSCS